MIVSIIGILMILAGLAWAALVFFAESMSDNPSASAGPGDFVFTVVMIGVGLLLIFA